MEQSSLNPKRIANTPRIYVASLADYNAGRLHGCWIDANQSADAIREEIAQMLADSEEFIAEEWAIHDYERFGDLGLSEYEDIELVAQVAFEITQHGPVFASLVSYLGGVSQVEEVRRLDGHQDPHLGRYLDHGRSFRNAEANEARSTIQMPRTCIRTVVPLPSSSSIVQPREDAAIGLGRNSANSQGVSWAFDTPTTGASIRILRE